MYPDHLRINGRNICLPSEFNKSDKLYRSYDRYDLDDSGEIRETTIRFPDVSFNWSRFSEPGDIIYRKNGKPTDGCYSITVETSRFENIANPVHDPINDDDNPNYAHVEVRVLKDGEDFNFEPPKGRKLNSKATKFKYRRNILNNHTKETYPVM
ncbi:hypothetical protein MBAV_003316 [Candidatus Magnetobacterium bavaricum]|uniref:Uncharacterized protein n=1 Tax=Candidatus Magnetobacterium bavaricum TaxID=29290 RepID=A0A0F3GRB2_9BACT|nr:hypothetical protein MBAV_003316 [Candidatus Magnetobacterium bavaricum]